MQVSSVEDLALARVPHQSDVLVAFSKVESKILAGVLQIMTRSDAQFDTAQMSLPVRLSGLGIHLVSDQDGAACGAAFLTAAVLTCRAASDGFDHFHPFKGASRLELAALWSDVCDRVLPCMSASSAAKFGGQLTDAMVADVLAGLAHSVSVELADFRQVQLLDGLNA